MTLERHIEELRAELRGVTDPAELRQIEAELKAAEMQQATLNPACDAADDEPDDAEWVAEQRELAAFIPAHLAWEDHCIARLDPCDPAADEDAERGQ